MVDRRGSARATPEEALAVPRHLLPTALFVASLIAAGTNIATAQELTPRAYWPAPAGTKVANFAYQYSTGDVITDPSLPVVGVDSKLHGFSFSLSQTFGMLGRTSSVQVTLPYSGGTSEGEFEGVPVRRDLSAIGDLRVRLAMNLKGAPTMDGPAFQRLRVAPHTIIGASVTVAAPTGKLRRKQDPQRWHQPLGAEDSFRRDLALPADLDAGGGRRPLALHRQRRIRSRCARAVARSSRRSCTSSNVSGPDSGRRST